MEPFAATIIFRRLKNLNIDVKKLSHDKCMSAMNRVWHFFPKCEELLDIGHRSMSLKKRIQNSTKKFPCLKGYGNKVKKHMLWCQKEHQGKLEPFQLSFMNGKKLIIVNSKHYQD